MTILGVDEAGRGPLAGPVVVAGVIFDKNCKIDGLADSKKISAKKREELYLEIIKKAKYYAIEEVPAKDIDAMNILQATLYGMKQVADKLENKFDMVLVDGNKLPNWQYSSEAIVKGDSKIPEISAASILAKVHRDRICLEYSKLYPEYDFDKHKGYPTKHHLEKLKKFGVLDIYRKTYKPVKNIIENI